VVSWMMAMPGRVPLGSRADERLLTRADHPAVLSPATP
jgi:hypothetical protein